MSLKDVIVIRFIKTPGITEFLSMGTQNGRNHVFGKVVAVLRST